MNVGSEKVVMQVGLITRRFLVGIFGFKHAVAGCVTLMRCSFRAMVYLGFATKNANILVVPHLVLIGTTPQNTFGILGKYLCLHEKCTYNHDMHPYISGHPKSVC